MAGNLTGNSFTQDKNKGVFLSNQVPKGTKADTFLARRVKSQIRMIWLRHNLTAFSGNKGKDDLFQEN